MLNEVVSPVIEAIGGPEMRLLAALAVLALASVPHPPGGPAPAAPVPMAAADLHDGTIVHQGGSWYAYGTRYGCGFTWRVSGTPWCGFGAASAPGVSGPWATPRLLFDPASTVSNTGWKGDATETWQQVCGSTGSGCFNPRMVRRPDGQWLLWFNAPADYKRGKPAYWVMSCSGPLGPCGAGTRGNWTHKPVMSQCNQEGDFTIAQSGSTAVIVCGTSRLSEERLTSDWLDGSGKGRLDLVGRSAEAPGVWWSGSQYVLTFSDPPCGYCSGTSAAAGPIAVHAGYATASSLMGPWTYRGYLSGRECAGQPRTTGAGFEWIDRWDGSHNQAAAKVALEPMTANPWDCGWQPDVPAPTSPHASSPSRPGGASLHMRLGRALVVVRSPWK